MGAIDISSTTPAASIGNKGDERRREAGHNDPVFIGEDSCGRSWSAILMTCIFAYREGDGYGMIARKRRWIVSSAASPSLAGRRRSAIYATAKAAVLKYTRCLAALLRRHMP